MLLGNTNGRAVTAVLALGLACGATVPAQCPSDWLPGGGIPGTDGIIYAATVFDDGAGPAVYVGGSFAVAGAAVANNIARWDPATQRWSALGSGTDGDVDALTVWDGKLYAGGSFATAGGVNASGIARWDPATQTWSSLGSGIRTEYWDDDPCWCDDPQCNCAPRWVSVPGRVLALAVCDGKLYAGGQFTTAGDVSADALACWDPAGQTWSAVGSGLFDAYRVSALAVLGGKLYVGGGFWKAGGVIANNTACWDPTAQTWSALGSGIADGYERVLALAVLGGRLYAGGDFATAGGVIANGIAAWDSLAQTWSPLGSGLTYVHGRARVYALTVLDGKLCVGGDLAAAGGMSANNVACWDPATQTWSGLGTGADGRVDALAVLDSRLYAGGWLFNTAGGASVSSIACWDPGARTWSALGSGTNGGLYAFAVQDNEVYAAGEFTMLDGVSANRIARWDSTTVRWSALGTGIDSQYEGVYNLAILDGKVYAGGWFSSAGGVSAKGIACWDPVAETWSALGSGLNGGVGALGTMDGKLYVGGSFDTAGGTTARQVACWDPATETWSPLGSGAWRTESGSEGVYAFAVLDDKLYVGGGFDMAGGVSANDIACWDPATQTWSALGLGIEGYGDDGFVNALVVVDGKLYAGGLFETAGGLSTNGFAVWDPVTQTWSVPEMWMEALSSVRTLTVLDGKLHVGASFATPGGGSVSSLACWDPVTQTWSTVEWRVGGRYPYVATLALLDGTLYVGGSVTTAGGRVSAYFARWGQVCPPGDMNCDDGVDFDDINPFVAALMGPETYAATYSECSWLNGDIDGDGDVNTDDINPFVRCLVRGQYP